MTYDAIVVGAGHNGLVAANYLARSGRRVIVLEARDVVGGACTTEELIAGSKWSSCAFIAGLLRPEIIEELELRQYGLELYQGAALSFCLFDDGRHLFLWKEIDRTLREIEKFSRADARRFLDFGLRIRRYADLVSPWLLRSPPERSELMATFEREGEAELFDEFTLLSVRDLLDRYFESDELKGLLTFFGMVSIWGGPSTPGTSYVWGHHSWGEFEGTFGQFGFARGGMGAISAALAASARDHGVQIRCGAPVERVIVENGRVVGARLRDGEEIRATQIISNADPKASLLRLVDADDLTEEFRHAVETIDVRGSMARIHLLIDELPQYLPFDGPEAGPQHEAHQLLGPSVQAFEQAWEAQRRGVFPERFVIEAVIQSATDPALAPPGCHTMTLGVQQVPFDLDGRTWDEAREEWTDLVLEDLFRYAPNLRGHILDRVTITPLDLEREYGLTGGNIFQGAMTLDQLFSARPLRQLAAYRTPIAGYYLCGAGTHPGGGVMGASGHNAAKAALWDVGIGAPVEAPGPTARGPQRLPDRVMQSRLGRRAAYHIARQPALRGFVRRFGRTR